MAHVVVGQCTPCCGQSYCNCACSQWVSQFITGTITITLSNFQDGTCTKVNAACSDHTLLGSGFNGSYIFTITGGSFSGDVYLGTLGDSGDRGNKVLEYYGFPGGVCTLYESYLYRVELLTLSCLGTSLYVDFRLRCQEFQGTTLNRSWTATTGTVILPWSGICEAPVTIENADSWSPATWLQIGGLSCPGYDTSTNLQATLVCNECEDC